MNFLCVSLVTCQCNTLNVHSYFVPFFPLTNKQANQKKNQLTYLKTKKKQVNLNLSNIHISCQNLFTIVWCIFLSFSCIMKENKANFQCVQEMLNLCIDVQLSPKFVLSIKEWCIYFLYTNSSFSLCMKKNQISIARPNDYVDILHSHWYKY